MTTPAVPSSDNRAWLGVARYPSLYVWYVFASSLDIMLTYAIVYRLGGREVNAIAAHLVLKFEHWGLIGLKFSTVILVIGVCEVVGRKNERAGRILALAAIVLSALPVGYGILQVLAWVHFGGEGPGEIPLDP